jgi:YD repeat-containing protein
MPHAEDAPRVYWTSHAWDLLGRPKRIEQPLGAAQPAGAVSTLSYAGASVTSRDAAGRTTVFLHDAEGRIVAVQAPLGGGASYAYDAFGQLTSITDAAGNRRQFAYDTRGLPCSRPIPTRGGARSAGTPSASW